jgi:RimJ/RimL family protein N-acetyltransferase
MSVTADTNSGLAWLRDGSTVELRDQQPADRELLAALFAGLSPRSRHLRFMAGLPPQVPASILDVLSAVDRESHFGLLAIREGRAIGAARYVRRAEDPRCAEVAFTVAEDLRRTGLAQLMVGALFDRALAAGIERLCFEFLSENVPALGLIKRLGGKPRLRGTEGTALLPLAA